MDDFAIVRAVIRSALISTLVLVAGIGPALLGCSSSTQEPLGPTTSAVDAPPSFDPSVDATSVSLPDGSALCPAIEGIECCRAEHEGRSAPCALTNEHGRCEGGRECLGDRGWGSCDAEPAAAESDNGADDDCDGETDEDLPGPPPECGDGECSPGETAQSCAEDCCVPDCSGRRCGDDGCGGSCGTCELGWTCDDDGKCGCEASGDEVCDGVDNDCNGVADDGFCPEEGPCTRGVCDAAGECTQLAVDSRLCTDGSQCTLTDACVSGECVGTGELDCDDGDPCTADGCDPAAGCTHEPFDGPCDDGNVCTADEACSGGRCVPGRPTDCNDGNPCTRDRCMEGTGCFSEPLSGTGCVLSHDNCPIGECHDGTCQHKEGETCTATVRDDLCDSAFEMAGECQTDGSCKVKKVPVQYSCPGCTGICLKCFVNVCVDL